MKRFAMVKGLALLMVMALALTGCFSKGKGPDKDPNLVVSEAMAAIGGVTSMNMLMAADVDIKAIDKEKTGFDKGHFEGTFDIGFDVKDAKMPKVGMKLDGKGSQDGGKEESAAGEVRILGNTLYASLTNMSDFQGNIPLVMVQPYFGKWWSIALPEDFTKDLSIYAKEEKDLTEEEKQMKALWDGKDVFTNVQYEGNEDVDGVATYVYSAELNKEEVKKTIQELAKTQGQPLSEDEIKKMDESWATLTFASKVYVDQKEMKMKRIAVTLNLKDLEGVDVDADLTFTYNNLGGEVAVEAPKDATEFDLGSLFGGFGGYDVPGVEPINGDPGL